MKVKAVDINQYMSQRTAHYQQYNEKVRLLVDRCLDQCGLVDNTEPPYEFNVDSLPRMAQIAFGARCARRLLLPSASKAGEQSVSSDCSEIVELVEKAAGIANLSDPTYNDAVVQVRARMRYIIEPSISLSQGTPWVDVYSLAARPVLLATALAAEALLDDHADNYRTAESFRKISLAAKLAWGGVPTGRGLIVENFHSLSEVAERESWTDDTPVGPHVFALLSAFETQRQIDGKTVLDVSSLVTDKLLSYFRSNPKRMYELTPRAFEELMAELFSAFGFHTTLLAQTRDGGRDIIAIDRRIAHLRYLIECKRRAPHLKVGIAPVQRLHGVVQGEGATKGILVTTSWFTKPAKDFLEKHEWQLDGCDFDRLTEWLQIYDRFRILAAEPPH